ncbi:MAG: rRNA methyltransferase [Betaproteobacteria bacterium]|nr:rRNA methyltransferase [Betaproteobacteria bacterium]
MAALYVVATPIGNLGDISARALQVLKAVDAIAAEDTRTSGPLLSHYGIGTRLFAAHEHNEAQAAEKAIGLLREGRRVALISDAGTPAISDPGARLVRAVRAAGFAVIPVPGANAAAAALSASGFEGAFHFAGFLPAKSTGRRAALRALAGVPATLVLYEAPHRILDLAADLAAELPPERRLVLARELTKRFESIHATTVGEALAWLQGDEYRQRGEFVVLIEAPVVAKNDDTLDAEAERVLGLLLAELPVSSASRLAADITRAPRKALYARALQLKADGDDDGSET